jgi:hypothetical protein
MSPAHAFPLTVFNSVGSGTLKKYCGDGTAVIFFEKCGSGNCSGKSTAVLPR